jgi:hypothetical protein
VEIYPHAFLTSTIDESEWLALCSDCFTTAERDPSIHWIGGWVRPRAGLDVKATRYPLDRRLGGTQSRSGRRGQKKPEKRQGRELGEKILFDRLCSNGKSAKSANCKYEHLIMNKKQ